MALHKLTLAPGINKDATPTTGKGGWYDCDKVRFRNGLPEKIGGWVNLAPFRTVGVPRKLHGWVTLEGEALLGIGTNKKFYSEFGGTFTDITPIRHTSEGVDDPLSTEIGSNLIRVEDALHGASNGDFVTIRGADSVGGIPAEEINGEHEIIFEDGSVYFIEVSTQAASTSTGGGSIDFEYQENVGLSIYVAGPGWGAGPWGDGGWGEPSYTGEVGRQLVLWNAANFGQTLLYGQRGKSIYKWDPTEDRGERGKLLEGDEVPITHDVLLVSDVSRYVVALGCNDIGSNTHDPLLIRWSDQDNYLDWMPKATNQAGSLRVSEGSYIVTALPTKQETLIWTDNAMYSMQYIGAPFVWSLNLQMSNLSIISPQAATTVSNLVFWMGKEKFYVYSGRVDPLPCTVSTHVFHDMNFEQSWQVFAGTNERFNEVWWFYCSAGSTQVDRYVIYNYVENVWSIGSLGRTAWSEAPGRPNPIAATPDGQLLYHEFGTDDNTMDGARALESYIISSDVDIGEGEQISFVWRMIPDISFLGSDARDPQIMLGLQARQNPGNLPHKEVGQDVRRETEHPVESFTEYVYTRIRGRQMAMRISSVQRGVHWRLGTPRVDIKADGRKS